MASAATAERQANASAAAAAAGWGPHQQQQEQQQQRAHVSVAPQAPGLAPLSQPGGNLSGVEANGGTGVAAGPTGSLLVIDKSVASAAAAAINATLMPSANGTASADGSGGGGSGSGEAGQAPGGGGHGAGGGGSVVGPADEMALSVGVRGEEQGDAEEELQLPGLGLVEELWQVRRTVHSSFCCVVGSFVVLIVAVRFLGDTCSRHHRCDSILWYAVLVWWWKCVPRDTSWRLRFPRSTLDFHVFRFTTGRFVFACRAHSASRKHLPIYPLDGVSCGAVIFA